MSRKVIFTKKMLNLTGLFIAIISYGHVLYKVVEREKEGRN